jgi:hypothetical protein
MGNLAHVAAEVAKALASGTHTAGGDKDAEWQRVNSYVADVLKDLHVLYAKLARLEGDFTGRELDHLSDIAEKVLIIGEDMSEFSKAFNEGKADMMRDPTPYDLGQGGGGQQPGNPPPPPSGSAEEGAPGGEDTYDVPMEMAEGGGQQQQPQGQE